MTHLWVSWHVLGGRRKAREKTQPSGHQTPAIPRCIICVYLLIMKNHASFHCPKVSAYNVGDPGSIPGSGRSSGWGNANPLPVLFPGKSHGQRSLVGYSPWGRKESDTTEWLHLYTWQSSCVFSLLEYSFLPFLQNIQSQGKYLYTK